MEEKFYTVEEVAELLHVHRQTVRKWYRAGKLDIVKLGARSVRVSEEALQRFLAENGLTDAQSGSASE